ncbi:MAG: hypothetical protein JW787_15025 [Sedimentisphaerales bacterium]|nr:hypothetical protein [Sedimentisphaerales bacterium]
MRPEQILQSTFKNLVFIVTMALFTSQAFCADPNGAKTPEKSQVKKLPEKKTEAIKITRPFVSPSSFRPDMSFREAINILRNSTSPPLNIVVLWKDLEEKTDITRDTPIEMDGLTGVPLKTHLNVLLSSLSSGSEAKLGYVVDGGVIIIATKDSLPKKMVARSYEITDIVAPPSMGGLMGQMPYGNMLQNGINNPIIGLNQYLNPGYPNQTYPNQMYPNQMYPNQVYPNQVYQNQVYPNQVLRPYNNLNTSSNTGRVPRF